MNYDSMISVIQSTSHTFHLTYNRLNDIVSTWEILSQTKKTLISCIFFLSDRWIHITHRGQNMQRDRIFHVNGAVWFIFSNREVIIFSINLCFTFTGLCYFSRQSMHINILKINTKVSESWPIFCSSRIPVPLHTCTAMDCPNAYTTKAASLFVFTVPRLGF